MNENLIPLAELMRPETLDDIVGQNHLLSQGKTLRNMIENDRYGSFVLWGPPGSGKTTIAKIIRKNTKHNFIWFSAVQSGIKEAKKIMQQAEYLFKTNNISTILFVDEIHRFNKAQQDAFLPYVESGYIILIGATTENPSFEIIPALLSRIQVYLLKKLNDKDVKTLLKRAVDRFQIKIKEDALESIVLQADGDARKAFNLFEIVIKNVRDKVIEIQDIKKFLSDKPIFYDKNGEEHYNIISAFHKSVRGSDPQAALYWLARMLEAGENPKYLARRLIRIASEDIGLADPNAIVLATSVMQTVNFVGMPECELALAELTVYLATAPKSNSIYIAYKNAKADAHNYSSLPVPYHIRNAPTKLMKNLGYSDNYKYDHDYENHYYYQKYFPDKMNEKEYYTPGKFGFEKEIEKRIKWYNMLKKHQKEN